MIPDISIPFNGIIVFPDSAIAILGIFGMYPMACALATLEIFRLNLFIYLLFCQRLYCIFMTCSADLMNPLHTGNRLMNLRLDYTYFILSFVEDLETALLCGFGLFSVVTVPRQYEEKVERHKNVENLVLASH